VSSSRDRTESTLLKRNPWQQKKIRAQVRAVRSRLKRLSTVTLSVAGDSAAQLVGALEDAGLQVIASASEDGTQLTVRSADRLGLSNKLGQSTTTKIAAELTTK
jgi:hypothetical protein